MRRILFMTAALGSLAAILIAAMAARSPGQSGGVTRLTIAIYAPNVQFANSAARLGYVQRLAKAVAANTGVKVEGLSFTSLSKLVRANPDFAIVEAQCVATEKGWRVLAGARIGGAMTRPWALYSRLGAELGSLQGKKLAYVKMGCNDSGFIDNAMLESEVDSKFFGGRVGKSDLSGAVAEVATYRGAHAVFAPAGSHKGLTRVFDAGAVPNPAFVQLNSRLSDDIVSRVRSAVTGYGGSSAIGGWEAGSDRPYRALRNRMGKQDKQGIFATPEPIRIDARDVLVEPDTTGEVAFPEIRQHFEKPPERQEPPSWGE